MTERIERCDALHDELLYNCRGEWITMDLLLSLLSEYYPPIQEGQNRQNSRARRLMTEDIRAINASPEYNHVIVHGNKGVKIATEEEARQYFGSKHIELARSYSLLRAIGRKIGLDGQIDLDGDVVEAFAGE